MELNLMQVAWMLRNKPKTQMSFANIAKGYTDGSDLMFIKKLEVFSKTYKVTINDGEAKALPQEFHDLSNK